MMENGWTKKLEQLETLLKAAKAARHVLNAVEAEEWANGGPETMPEAEALREAIAAIEEGRPVQ